MAPIQRTIETLQHKIELIHYRYRDDYSRKPETTVLETNTNAHEAAQGPNRALTEISTIAVISKPMA